MGYIDKVIAVNEQKIHHIDQIKNHDDTELQALIQKGRTDGKGVLDDIKKLKKEFDKLYDKYNK